MHNLKEQLNVTKIVLRWIVKSFSGRLRKSPKN